MTNKIRTATAKISLQVGAEVEINFPNEIKLVGKIDCFGIEDATSEKVAEVTLEDGQRMWIYISQIARIIKNG
jgi:hypothetical protein